MVIFSLLELVGSAFMSAFGMHFFGGFGGFGVIISLILGIVAIVGSKHATELIWAIGLIVIGFIGGGIGGLLVLLGGILGLISRFI